MKKILFILLLLPITLFSQQESAESILKEAGSQAAKESKKVFIIFHASWCGWCHKMDTAMNDPVCRNYFDESFVVRHMTVYESKDKTQFETPGALELLKKYKGADQGIPFWLIFDAEGNLVADSKIRAEGASLNEEGDNAGCPASEKEVAYFIQVLRKTTPISEEGLQVISRRFRKNESH